MSENRNKVTEEHAKDVKDYRPKNLTRRSSIQKVMHICNQTYLMFPYAFLWVQDFQTSILTDLKKVILFVESLMALRLGVYLCMAFLSAELVYCLIAVLTWLVPAGSAFFFFCIGILSLLAFQIFDVALELRKKLRGSFFVKKKKVN